MGVMGSDTVTVSSDIKKLLKKPSVIRHRQVPLHCLSLLRAPVRAIHGHTTLKTALLPVPLTDLLFLLNFLPITFLIEKLEERGRRKGIAWLSSKGLGGAGK